MGTILNLSDVQRNKSQKGDTFGAAVVEMFAESCDLAALMDFKTLGTVEQRSRRTDSIPTVGFRQGRGTSFGTISGITTDQIADAVYALGAQIDIDKTDLKDKNAGDILGERTRLATKGMAWTFTDYFVNGDHATEPHGFEGLKVRLANSPSGQIVYGNSSSAELDVRAAASPSEATLYSFLDKIDQAIDQLDGHMADVALTDSDFIATLRSVLRRINKYTELPVRSPNMEGSHQRRSTSNRMNGPVLIYPESKGIKWYDVGYKADQTTKVIGTDTVNSVACRPVYFVKLGYPYVHGIQQYPMEVDSPTKLNDGVTYRVVIDWPVGIAHVHNKSIAKLAGVRVA